MARKQCLGTLDRPRCRALVPDGQSRCTTCQRLYRQAAYGAQYRSQRKTLIEDDPYARCAICGSTKDLQLDHVVGIKGGRIRGDERRQVLCRIHNRRKG